MIHVKRYLYRINIQNLKSDVPRTPSNVYFILGWRLLEFERRQSQHRRANNNQRSAHGKCNHTRSIAMTNFPSASLEQCTEFDKILLTITFIAALIAVYNFIIQQQKSKLDVAETKKED